MKIITAKNAIPIICVSFTVIVCGKLLFEKLAGITDRYYTENILSILVFSVIVTAILALHYYLQRFPLIPVLIGQYAVIVAAAVGYIVFVYGHSIHDTKAIWEMVRSVTIPYIVGAGTYYAAFFMQIKKANNILSELKPE